ncbi:hypothetical protein [Nocardiopsis kunsanensis]|uniref:Secreted protein n=1 Tax=Nocardiopsis kunsanensis TaxID=141693 RepID=A0A918X8Y9_9ACTN|nr:hypothetical protein [Nocardiopsis kunsanensis]GHD18438.1 hypothetical protein GCM10007147_08640 [Nocardiopsis kunsanensis]
MLTNNPVRRLTACAALPLFLLAAGCSESHGRSPEQLDAMIAEEAREANETEGDGTPESRFDPESLMCEPAVDAPGGWRTETPRNAVAEEPVELGAMASEETDVTGAELTVVGPDDEPLTATVPVEGDEWATVEFPGDFEGAELASGVYTVLWTDEESGSPLACDGFEVG